MPEWSLCDGGGNAAGDHCCYVGGAPCPHLQVDGASGRRFACGLFVELGNWAAVHADARYAADVKPHWDQSGVVGCGPWFGCNRETFVTLRANRATPTVHDVIDNTQCCFRRRVLAATTNAQRNAVRNGVRDILAAWPDLEG